MSSVRKPVRGVTFWLRKLFARSTPVRQRPVRRNFILAAGASQLSESKILQVYLFPALADLWRKPVVQAAGVTVPEFLDICLGSGYNPQGMAAIAKALAIIPVPPVTSKPAQPVDWQADSGVQLLKIVLSANKQALRKFIELRNDLARRDNPADPGYSLPAADRSGADEALLDAAGGLANAILKLLPLLVPAQQGADGPLGAELTALLAFAREEAAAGTAASPGFTGGHLTILAPQTWMGFFAACVLQQVLARYGSMDVTLSDIQILAGAPQSSTLTMQRLATQISNALRGSSPDDAVQWDNVLVSTSDDPAIAPCMTIFALLYGVRMIAAVGQDLASQTIYPRYDLQDPGARDFWQAAWQRMKAQGWADQTANPYLSIALQGRMTESDKTYSA